MTANEMKETMDQVRKELKPAIEQVDCLLTVLMEELDEHPGIITNISEMLVKYADLCAPFVHKICVMQINAREQAFLRFRQLRLDDDQAIKLVCGR